MKLQSASYSLSLVNDKLVKFSRICGRKWKNWFLPQTSRYISRWMHIIIMHINTQLQGYTERHHQGSLNILRRSLSLVKLQSPRVDPSSKYTPVVISTFTSHLWKRKKGLVLVVCITKYQPRLVFAWRLQHVWTEEYSIVSWGIWKENEQREPDLFLWVIVQIIVSKEQNVAEYSLFQSSEI